MQVIFLCTQKTLMRFCFLCVSSSVRRSAAPRDALWPKNARIIIILPIFSCFFLIFIMYAKPHRSSFHILFFLIFLLLLLLLICLVLVLVFLVPLLISFSSSSTSSYTSSYTSSSCISSLIAP